MWAFIISLILVSIMLVFSVVEAIWELDHWIATRDARERDGYDYENDRPIKSIPLTPKVNTESVKKLPISIDNFPKSPEDAKAKIARLLKSQTEKSPH
jgi:hypothetical protein